MFVIFGEECSICRLSKIKEYKNGSKKGLMSAFIEPFYMLKIQEITKIITKFWTK